VLFRASNRYNGQICLSLACVTPRRLDQSHTHTSSGRPKLVSTDRHRQLGPSLSERNLSYLRLRPWVFASTVCEPAHG
jgi:hypothetical protein